MACLFIILICSPDTIIHLEGTVLKPRLPPLPRLFGLGKRGNFSKITPANRRVFTEGWDRDEHDSKY